MAFFSWEFENNLTVRFLWVWITFFSVKSCKILSRKEGSFHLHTTQMSHTTSNSPVAGSDDAHLLAVRHGPWCSEQVHSGYVSADLWSVSSSTLRGWLDPVELPYCLFRNWFTSLSIMQRIFFYAAERLLSRRGDNAVVSELVPVTNIASNCFPCYEMGNRLPIYTFIFENKK